MEPNEANELFDRIKIKNNLVLKNSGLTYDTQEQNNISEKTHRLVHKGFQDKEFGSSSGPVD
jgi:hypothetical protein